MAFTDTHLEQFEREYGCTPAEWLGWMPEATQGCDWQQLAANGQAMSPTRPELQGRLRIQLASNGCLETAWQVLEPRRIALVTLPRMKVRFQFHNVAEEQRKSFMRVFDLHLQRGGG